MNRKSRLDFIQKNDEKASRKKLTAIKEDMRFRPKLYSFLSGLIMESKRVYGHASYEMLHNTFWRSLHDLSWQERNVITEDFILGMNEKEIIQENSISRAVLYRLKKTAREKLEKFILKDLVVEEVLQRMKKIHQKETV